MTETKRYKLIDLGWNEELDHYLNQFNKENQVDYKVGRVAVEYKALYKIFTTEGEILGSVSGKMQHEAVDRQDYPAVGDWIIIDKTNSKAGNAVIHGILPRKSKFSRKIAGKKSDEQIVASNIDYLFICMSLNKDFNLKRLDRYLIMAWDGGANPVILLTKSDLCSDESFIQEKVNEIESIAFGVDIHVISSYDGIGIDNLSKYIDKGITLAFLGSSGVGKSTLINTLIGEEKLETREIRDDDDKGKHTTTHRELIPLEGGGIVIDTPGMRELHMLDTEGGLDSTFKDIEDLALSCKFNNCGHKSEPGCAVKKALYNGTLTGERLNNYFKLQKEIAFIERKNKMKEKRAEKKSKKI